MTGPQDPAAAGRDRLRAGHADREQVIEALKAAFVQGMLAKDEFDARVGQALASRTYADLAALTADIPPAPAAARLARPPAPQRRRPLVRAAAESGVCLVIAAAALWGASILDPGPNVPGHGGGGVALVLFVAICAVLAALGVLASGVVISWEQRRSPGQLPPRPGPGGHALDGERHGGTGPFVRSGLDVLACSRFPRDRARKQPENARNPCSASLNAPVLRYALSWSNSGFIRRSRAPRLRQATR
jgi:uncharacterized protein DUF1707